jgi:hypothetical protein
MFVGVKVSVARLRTPVVEKGGAGGSTTSSSGGGSANQMSLKQEDAMDGFSILFVFILGVVLVVAQFQLFAIKRYLHDLLQLQLALHRVTGEPHLLCVAKPHPIEPMQVTVVQSRTAGSGAS